MVTRSSSSQSNVSVDREIRTPLTRDVSPRVYLKLASDTLRGGRFETYADLVDAMKTACARLRVPYDGPAINQAVRTIALRRGGVLVAAERQPVPIPKAEPDRELSKGESVEVLKEFFKRFEWLDTYPKGMK